jgi:hypothetical protein
LFRLPAGFGKQPHPVAGRPLTATPLPDVGERGSGEGTAGLRTWARFPPLPTFTHTPPQLYPASLGNQGRLKRNWKNFMEKERTTPRGAGWERAADYAERRGG